MEGQQKMFRPHFLSTPGIILGERVILLKIWAFFWAELQNSFV